MRRLLLPVALLLAGCGSDDADRATSAAPGPSRAAARPTVTPRPVPAARTVAFRAADGVRLTGDLRRGPVRRAPVVVLVHESDGGPDQWKPFSGVLHAAGFASFAYESRESDRTNERVLVDDLAGAVKALSRRSDVDPDRIGVVGASIGGGVAAWGIGTRPELRLRAGVGLSPPLIIPEGDERFRPHDLLLLADARELSSAQGTAEEADGGVVVRQAPEPGHGVALLADPRVTSAVVGWLRERLGRER